MSLHDHTWVNCLCVLERIFDYLQIECLCSFLAKIVIVKRKNVGVKPPTTIWGEGGGAHINNNFSEFFPFRYKLFFIIVKSRSSFETIGELLVVTTDPIGNMQMVFWPIQPRWASSLFALVRFNHYQLALDCMESAVESSESGIMGKTMKRWFLSDDSR